MQRGFAPIFILIGIVVAMAIVGGAYYFVKSQVPKPKTQNTVAVTPTPQPITNASPAPNGAGETANWKTYSNQKDSISFKYPGDWKLTVKDNTYSGYDEVTVAKVIKVPMPDQSDKTIESIEEEFYVYPVKDNGKPQFNNWQPSSKKVIDKIECNGKESSGGQQQPPNRYYECIFNGINFGISLISTKSNFSILDQILSTFKFLDTNDDATGKYCGGFKEEFNQCPKGYKCNYDGDYPDSGGKCIKE